MGFGDDYWRVNYGDPHVMDGMFNARDHARYLRHLFRLDGIDVRSIADFGFGLGVLFEELLAEFRPYRALGIEPSPPAFAKVEARGVHPGGPTELRLERTSLQRWCAAHAGDAERFDLGVCTSVLQYVSDDDLARVLPVLSDKVRWLYLTVPTRAEAAQQHRDWGFRDPWALHRSRADYHALLAPWFTIVSNRLLESRTLFDEETTRFSEDVFRF